MKNIFSILEKHSKSKLLLLMICIFIACSGQSQNINNPNKLGPLGAEVNTYSGNLLIPRNDLLIPAKGIYIDLSFYYNSFNYNQNIGFGNGWGFALSMKYTNDSAGNKTFIWGDGREDVYTAAAGGVFLPPKGFFNTLTQYQPYKFLLTEPEGAKYYFNDTLFKKISRMEDANGNFINFNYTDSQLVSIVNNAGQTISFTYNGTGRLASLVDAITSPTRTYTYTYDGYGNLTQVTDPLGGTHQYTYLINGPMKTLSDKNSNTIDIIYYPDFTVSELIGCNKRQSFSYDTSSKQTVVTDYVPTGTDQVTTYGYKLFNDQIWLSSLTSNCCGFNMTFDYDNSGNKIKETDANGNITSYTYDDKGNVLTIKDALGQTVSYTYSANYNKITSFTDAKGNVTSMSYNSTGNLISLTTPGNLIYTATYNADGNITSSTDPKGNTFNYNYDSYGNPASVSGPNGYHATLACDAHRNLLSYIDTRGNTSTYEYDILDRLKKITDPLNNIVQFNYDAEGNPILFKNQANENSLLKFDASNRLVQVTDAMNNKSYISYDAMDNRITVKNALGASTNLSYDARNRLNVVKDALGNTGYFSYDANGNIISINLPNGEQLNYTYDALNRVTSIKDNTGTITNLVYDKNNNIVSRTNGTGAISTALYDSLNRIKQITDPLGNSTLISYDVNSNITGITDRNGFTVNYVYDSLNRIKSFTDNNGSVIAVTLDAAGNTIALKDQDNNTTNYTYDNLNRVKTTTYPDGKFLDYTYDNRGNLITVQLTDGTSINYVYDSLNQVISKTIPGGQVFNYTYDALGRVITAANDAGTVILSYDALNRLVSESFDGRITRYYYDVTGRKQTTIYPDSTSITKSYDTRNRLISITRGNSTLVNYQYNANDKLITKTFANGISTNLQYDFANRLTSFSTANGVLQNTAFTYDKEKNKQTINRLNNPALSEQFSYDNGYRLTNYKRGVIGGTPVIQNSYSLDAVGNRTSAVLNGVSTNYTYNNLNQLTNSNNGSQNINFTYDNNGNLTFDGNYHKAYNAVGQLIKDSASVNNVITYQYDALGRRVQKNINGIPYKYSYSGLAQIEERDGITNNLLNRSIFNGFLTPVVNEKNGNTYFYHQNEVNSVEAISNGVGNLIESYRYDVYGNPVIYDSLNNLITASYTGNRIGFTGQEYDTATGSYHFFFRNYSPSTGIFNQRDPRGYADEMGMYQYVGDNPANGIDVLGLETLDKDPCAHDPNKIKFITKWEIERTKRYMIEYQQNYFPDYDYNSNLAAIGSADSRYYDGLSRNQFGNNEYFFKGNQYHNYEVNYYFTGYAAGYRGFGATFSQGTSRLWNGLKGAKDIWDGKGADRFESAFNPVDTRTTLNHSGNLDARSELGSDFVSGARDVVTGGSLMDLFNVVVDPRSPDNNPFGNKLDNRVTDFGEWWPVIDPRTGEMGYEFFSNKNIPSERMQEYRDFIKNNCPQNNHNHGTRKRVFRQLPNGDSVEIVQSNDPNFIDGPNGQPHKHWVSIKDRLPYTILYENSKAASAPAKFVRITSPVEPKEDATSFQLGNFGFNNQTFDVPPSTAAYYQRLDCRDSLGLFVDVTAGYDQLNNVAFWQFQSIDPITLLPPTDPLKGFLLMQDSTKPNAGHGFVNFSMKPVTSAITLDTIGARATIVFDGNDTIPTNIHTNTIDAFAPTSHMTSLPANSNNPVALSWSGVDDPGGCGLKYYTLYVSSDGINFNIIRSGITRTDTSFIGATNTTYYFFVLATDSVGNTEVLRPGEIRSTFIGNGGLPVTWLYFNGSNRGKNNLLDWATANELNAKQFNVERSLDGNSFTQIGIVNAAGNSSQNNTYQYTDMNIDRLNSAVMFYRLKQIDIGGTYHYSNIVRLTYKTNATVSSIVYPNPTAGMITILVGDNTLVGTEAGLFDVNGRFLETIKISANSQQVDLRKYVNGMYFIKLSDKETLKVVKQ